MILHYVTFYITTVIYLLLVKKKIKNQLRLSVISLLSLILPSYMVVLDRKLVNISFSFNINNSKKFSINITIDMKVDISRDCSVSLSINGSRTSLTHSYASSIEYAKCVKAITNNTI